MSLWCALQSLPSVIRGRCGPAALRCVERLFDDASARHAPLPYQLPIEVDFGPHFGAELQMRRREHREGDVALAGGRPDGGGHAADLAFSRAVAVQLSGVRSLIAVNVWSHEPAAHAAAFLCE